MIFRFISFYGVATSWTVFGTSAQILSIGPEGFQWGPGGYRSQNHRGKFASELELAAKLRCLRKNEFPYLEGCFYNDTGRKEPNMRGMLVALKLEFNEFVWNPRGHERNGMRCRGERDRLLSTSSLLLSVVSFDVCRFAVSCRLNHLLFIVRLYSPVCSFVWFVC